MDLADYDHDDDSDNYYGDDYGYDDGGCYCYEMTYDDADCLADCDYWKI